jgi:putative addiction module component (TIGR02574 family)
MPMSAAEKLLAEAMALPADEREELAAKLLDSLEPPPGISVEDKDEIERRAAEARSGASGVAWDEVKRNLRR